MFPEKTSPGSTERWRLDRDLGALLAPARHCLDGFGLLSADVNFGGAGALAQQRLCREDPRQGPGSVPPSGLCAPTWASGPHEGAPEAAGLNRQAAG